MANPPDYVVFAHRWWQEFGVGPFGTDPRNGRALVEWVHRDYRRVARYGAEPFGPKGFGVSLYERRPAAER